MPLPIPNLDDRNFATLLAEAKAMIPARCPQWTDLSPSDPGVVMLELFAFLTDALLYRLNRIPNKAFLQLLNIVGVQLSSPAAAAVSLTFSREAATDHPIQIPRGTAVTTGASAGQAPIFRTVEAGTLAAGATSTTVRALHCDEISGELIGTGTSLPGQRASLARPPVILDSGDGADLLIGVEVATSEFDQRVPVIRFGDRTYRVWRPVDHFGELTDADDRHVYVVDRNQGLVTFAPSIQGGRPAPAGSVILGSGLMAEVPAAGRQIVACYRTGGGSGGNVAAGSLTVLPTGPAGITVINPGQAVGGRDAETLDGAVARAPHSLASLDRVVTARDYEAAAVAAGGGVSRALAETSATLWAGGTPGQVRVFVMPELPEHRAATLEEIRARQLPTALRRIADVLAVKTPMSAEAVISWAGCKSFHVEATVVAHRTEDLTALRDRLVQRLQEAFCPTPVDGRSGWPFGEAVRSSVVYDVLLAERGVRFVESVRLVVDEVPRIVSAIQADPCQRGAWFCASGPQIFRTLDDAQGWELLDTFEGEICERLASCAAAPGLLVVTSRVGDTEASRVHLSTDYGESFQTLAELDFHIEGVAVGVSGQLRAAFLATDRGLFRLDLASSAVPVSLLVSAQEPAKPFYAVQVVSEPGTDIQLAAAAQELGGVFVSFQDARSGTFQAVGGDGQDIRVLGIQRAGPRRFLIAGTQATGDEAGAGIHQLELRDTQPDPSGWQPVGTQWTGGSCLAMAFVGQTTLAATSRSGVTVSDPAVSAGRWRASGVDSGQPLLEAGRFEPVSALAATDSLFLAGGPQGVNASTDAAQWKPASNNVFADKMALPPTWLPVGGDHILEVVYDSALR